MLLYITLSFLLTFFLFLEIFLVKKRCTYWLYIFSFFLFCLSFLRWRVGTDWDSYYEIYLHPELYANMETGFMMINSIGKYYFESYTVTLFIQGILLFYFSNCCDQAAVSFSYDYSYAFMGIKLLWYIFCTPICIYGHITFFHCNDT